MSYQSIEVDLKERFFTVVNRGDGLGITTGTVNYYLRAKSGVDDGKWWDDSTKTWVVSETANPMSHEADGHWEIDLIGSPFTQDIRFLEYVKESGDLHVPDSRHLIANLNPSVIDPDNQGIADILAIVQDPACDTDAIIAAMIAALSNVSIEPEKVILGACQENLVPFPGQICQENNLSSSLDPIVQELHPVAACMQGDC